MCVCLTDTHSRIPGNKFKKYFHLWTGRRGGFNSDNTRENLNFYVGSMSGVIYYLNENGSCMEVLQADGAIR